MDRNGIRITLITEYFPPEIGAGSNRAFENASEWINAGAHVTVLTGFPDYPDGKIPSNYKGYFFKKEYFDKIEVIRTFTIPVPNKGHFKRILSSLIFLISSVIQGSFSLGKQDIIVATSPPFFVGISGYLISRLKRVPFIFELRDLWPDSIVQLGQLKNKFLIKLWEDIELFLYKKSKQIVVVTDSYVEILKEKGIRSEKISVIKNGISIESNLPTLSVKEIKNKLNINNEFVFAYIGTIGLSHALDTVVESAEKLKDNKEILFLIIGDGAEKEILNNKSQNLKLTNIKFLDKIERNELSNYYQIVDVLIVPLKNIALFRSVIPSKIFEIMKYGKPILLGVDGESKKIVEEAKAGISFLPENVDDFVKQVMYLNNNRNILKEFSENGRRFVEKNFNRKILAKKYLTLLEDLLKNNKSIN